MKLPSAEDTLAELTTNFLLGAIVSQVNALRYRGGMELECKVMRLHCDVEWQTGVYTKQIDASFDDKNKLIPFLLRLGYGIQTYTENSTFPYRIDFPGRTLRQGEDPNVCEDWGFPEMVTDEVLEEGPYFYPRSVRQVRMWGLLFCCVKFSAVVYRARKAKACALS